MLVNAPTRPASSIIELELIDRGFFAESILSLLDDCGVFGIAEEVLGIVVVDPPPIVVFNLPEDEVLLPLETTPETDVLVLRVTIAFLLDLLPLC